MLEHQHIIRVGCHIDIPITVTDAAAVAVAVAVDEPNRILTRTI
jgi:hypothetical protein